MLKQKQQQKEAEDQSEQHNLILQNLIEQNFAKPTNVEAQRIIKIIDELLINMEILCYLDADFISNFVQQDGLNEVFDPNMVESMSPQLMKLLSYQGKLEAKFTELTNVEECNRI
jgi:predicted component of type VI protein secretion system